MTTIGSNDFDRLISEITLNDGRSPEDLIAWFEDRNFDQDVFDSIVTFCETGMVGLLQETARMLIEEAKEEGNDSFVLAMGSESIHRCAAAIGLGMFQIGWEARTQYGPRAE